MQMHWLYSLSFSCLPVSIWSFARNISKTSFSNRSLIHMTQKLMFHRNEQMKRLNESLFIFGLNYVEPCPKGRLATNGLRYRCAAWLVTWFLLFGKNKGNHQINSPPRWIQFALQNSKLLFHFHVVGTHQVQMLNEPFPNISKWWRAYANIT